MTGPTPHEADLIKSAELLMRVIPESARADIMLQYCAACGCVWDECQCAMDYENESTEKR